MHMNSHIHIQSDWLVASQVWVEVALNWYHPSHLISFQYQCIWLHRLTGRLSGVLLGDCASGAVEIDLCVAENRWLWRSTWFSKRVRKSISLKLVGTAPFVMHSNSTRSSCGDHNSERLVLSSWSISKQKNFDHGMARARTNRACWGAPYREAAPARRWLLSKKNPDLPVCLYAYST